MTIVRVTDDMEIVAGAIVCATTAKGKGFCTEPRKIAECKGARLYYINAEQKQTHMLRNAVMFQCTTMAEGEAIAKLSIEQDAQIVQQLAELELKIQGEFEAKVAGLMGR